MRFGKIDKLFKDREFFQHAPFDLITFEENVKEDMIKKIEEHVVDWLKVDDAGPLKEIKFKDKNGNELFDYLQFDRSEIYVKTCRNVWDVWRIATAGGWPRIISYKVKEIGLNDYDEDIVPNEIRSEAYSSSNDHEEEKDELMKTETISENQIETYNIENEDFLFFEI